MGEGYFGIDRPGTVGDSGWFGAPRPLVGAANGIRATVTTTSAAQVAVANSTPESIKNLRDELNSINRALDNKREKLSRIKEAREERAVFGISVVEDISMERVESLMDDEIRLENQRDDIINRLNKARNAADEGDIPMHEVEDGIQEPVTNALQGMGISKGPFIDVGTTQTEILFSMVNVREEDISETRQTLEELGFQVGEVDGVEMDKLFS